MHSIGVCIFTETYYPEVGGGETQARLLAEGLAADGHTAMILTRRSRPQSPPFEIISSTRVYRLAPSGSGQLKKWGLIFSSIPWLLRMRRHYDVVIVSGYRVVGISAVLISKLLGKPCVLKADSQHEMSGEFFSPGLSKRGLSPNWWAFRIFLRVRNFILRRADAFVAITREMVQELGDAGVAPRQIHLIPNGVDTACFNPVEPASRARLRAMLGLPHQAPVAVYTGRLVSYKGLPLLLRVWRRIQQKHANATLVLVGTGGLDIHNCETELQEYVSQHALGDTIRFAGSVANVHEYLQAADMFVFPTENDAFPSSVIEAMACALPVVTTHIGALRDFVVHGENGLVVVPGDEQGLYEALDTLLCDAPLSLRLGQEAARTAHTSYSSTRVAKAYLDLLGALVNPPTSQMVESAHSEERLR